MFEYAKYSKALENMIAPKDLISSVILINESIPLRCVSAVTGEIPEISELLYRNVKNTKKHSKNAWDVDIKSSGPGYFDEAGNFILSKPKRIVVSWILKRNGTTEGPFTEKEFKNILSTISYTNCLVKRDFDKGFVELEKLMQEVPSLNFKDLNRFFSNNQSIE